MDTYSLPVWKGREISILIFYLIGGGVRKGHMALEILDLYCSTESGRGRRYFSAPIPSPAHFAEVLFYFPL